MPAMRHNPDGTWTEATPVAYQPGYDAEVGVQWDSQGRRRYSWMLMHSTPEQARRNQWCGVALGTSRTHAGATVRLILAKWWDQVKRRV